MKQRIITGIVAGIIFLTILFIGQIYIFLLLFLLALLGLHELLRMKHFDNISLTSVYSFLILCIIFGQNIFSYQYFSMEGLTITLLIGLAIPVLSKNRHTFDDMSFAFFSALYIAVGFYSFYLVRIDTTFMFTLMILLAIWGTDTGAYFTGSLFKGRGPKLWESISPKKTVVGAIGGSILAIIIIIVLTPYAFDSLTLSQQILLGIVIAVIGQLGDLVQSAYKRSYNVKDSGTILPGHGGILDRFDSFIYVFPIVYIFLLHL